MKDEAPWAGDRLIFVGDYAHGYTNDVISEEDIEEWKRLEAVDDEDSDVDGNDDPTGVERNPIYVLGDRGGGGSVEVLNPARHEEWMAQYKAEWPGESDESVPEFQCSTTCHGVNRDALLYCLQCAMGQGDLAVLEMAFRLLRGSAKERGRSSSS